MICSSIRKGQNCIVLDHDGLEIMLYNKTSVIVKDITTINKNPNTLHRNNKVPQLIKMQVHLEERMWFEDVADGIPCYPGKCLPSVGS